MKANRLSLLEELTLEKKKGFKKMHRRQTTHPESASLQEVVFPSLVQKHYDNTNILPYLLQELLFFFS